MARPKPLADFVDACLGPALSAKGFASADVFTDWADIVGERLACHTEPLRMEWPRARAELSPGRPEGATLVVRVTGSFGLELQHCAPLVIERVNAHFGWCCVARLAMRQGPVMRARTKLRPQPMAPNPESEARLRQAVVGFAESGLEKALLRLGRGVLSDCTGTGKA